MASGLTLLQSDPSDVPTPATGKVTIFFNTNTGLPSYKDDSGTVSPLGTAGSQGPAGPSGPAGRDGADTSSYFPGGWR